MVRPARLRAILAAGVLLLLLPPRAHALIISAPAACGGERVVTHASAFFGPKLAAASVLHVPLFAPPDQRDGRYVPPAPLARPASEPPPPLLALVKVLVASVGVRGLRAGKDSAPAVVSAVARPTVAGAVMARAGVRQAGEVLAGVGHGELATKGADFALFNACMRLSVEADVKAAKGRVVLVSRGMCDFAQKVSLMQDEGAAGVIVVNYKSEGTKLANMKLNDTKLDSNPIRIPAVMISYKDWASVAPCRNSEQGILVSFTAEGEATFDIDYGRDALNWAMMRGMALWILCQCGVNVVRYKRRVSEFRARADAIAALPADTFVHPDHEQARPRTGESASTSEQPQDQSHDHDPERISLLSSAVGGVEEAIEATSSAPAAAAAASSSSTAVDDDDDAVDDVDDPVCAVCLDDFEHGQQVRRLACSHLYHRTCIDPWLQTSSNCCPLCKREVPNLPPPPSQVHYGAISV